MIIALSIYFLSAFRASKNLRKAPRGLPGGAATSLAPSTSSRSRDRYPLEPQDARVERRSVAAAALAAVLNRPGRILAAAEAALGTLFFWRGVSATIQRLSMMDDAALKAMGIERQEIVPWAYEAAMAERRSRAARTTRRRKPKA